MSRRRKHNLKAEPVGFVDPTPSPSTRFEQNRHLSTVVAALVVLTLLSNPANAQEAPATAPPVPAAAPLELRLTLPPRPGSPGSQHWLEPGSESAVRDEPHHPRPRRSRRGRRGADAGISLH